MMNAPLISVIVPVYNVAAYLEECLESILLQSYSNLEIICIDDGSTDGSSEICDRMAKKDDRIIVIHQKNCGAGAARNVGLKHANGEYIGFIDSDDYIDAHFYETLLNSIINNHAQISSCELSLVYKNNIISLDVEERNELISGKECLKLAASHWKYYIMVNKLFCRNIINGAVFPEGNIIDDGFFTYKIIAKADKVAWCYLPMYYYRQRRSSVMNLSEYQVRREYDMIDLLKERLEYVKAHYPFAVSAFQRKMLDSYYNSICGGKIDDVAIKNCLYYMRRNCKEALFKEYTFKECIWWIVFLCFPKSMIKRDKCSNICNIVENDYYE